MTALTTRSAFGLEPVDEIDDIEESATSSAANAGAGDRDGKMRFAGTGSADEDDVALLGDEIAVGEVAHQALIDGRAVEKEVVDILCERQLGDRQLIFDGSRLLLRDLGLEQIADEALRLVLAFDGCRKGLVVGAPHAIELEFVHHVENFGTFHDHEFLS